MAVLVCLLGVAGSTPVAAQAHPQRLTIEEAVREAVEHNLSLLARRHGVGVAEAEIVTARLRPNPVMSLGAEQMDPWTGLTNAAGVGPAEYAVRTEFLIEGPGKRARRIEVAQHELAVAQLELLDSIRALVLEVCSAGVDVLLAKANLALAQENLRGFEEILRINQARFERGDIARVELVRTQLATFQFRNSVRQKELELRNALEQLRLLLGRPATAGAVDLVDEFRTEELPLALERVHEMALERRPDLRAAERAQARALADVRLQLAQRRLDYAVGAEYRRHHRTGHALGFFFSFPLPVFDRNQGEILRARAEQRQAETTLRALRAQIATEVQTAYAEFMLTRDRLRDIKEEMVGPARQVREVMEFSYRRGEASLLELLDAQMAFNETLEAFHEAQAGYARNLYRLESVAAMTVVP